MLLKCIDSKEIQTVFPLRASWLVDRIEVNTNCVAQSFNGLSMSLLSHTSFRPQTDPAWPQWWIRPASVRTAVEDHHWHPLVLISRNYRFVPERDHPHTLACGLVKNNCHTSNLIQLFDHQINWSCKSRAEILPPVPKIEHSGLPRSLTCHWYESWSFHVRAQWIFYINGELCGFINWICKTCSVNNHKIT